MFSYDLSSSDTNTALVAKVRLWLGDTVQGVGVLPDGSNFQDEEILLMLDLNGNDSALAVTALYRPLAARWAVYADVTVGPRKEALSQVAERWQKLAEAAEAAKAAAVTGFILDPIRNDGFYQEYGLQE